MTRKKSRRLAELDLLPHVVTVPRGESNPGLLDRFSQGCPITLEIGCGKGEYTVELARHDPEQRFVGIDLKGDRLHRAASAAQRHNLQNVLFVRIEAERLREIIRPDSVAEIWLTYPDPHPGPTDSRRRLTAPEQLALYRELLTPGGCIHLKTDDFGLYEFTRRSLEEQNWHILDFSRDLYGESGLSDDRLRIQSTFERRHLAAGRAITYLRFAPW